MARPLKSGADYFPLDTQMDDKIELIEAEFGLVGFAIVVKLWQKIYAGRGYYCEWNEEVALLFAKKNVVGCNVVSEIISASIRRGIFDSSMYDKYKILTSKGIQRRYLEMTSRRTEIELDKRYLLIDVPKNSVIVYINGVNVDNNSKNENNNSQSKVKESKVNKSKVKNSEPKALKPIRHKYGYYNNVLLSDEDIEKLKKEFSSDWEERVEKVSEYCASTGKSYKNYLATIRTWAKRDKQKIERPVSVPKSKFNNYTETNKTDYESIEKKLLDDMLGD